jgi:hypothetical protein
LVNGSNVAFSPKQKSVVEKNKFRSNSSSFLPSAALRTQQLLARSLNSRTSKPSSSKSSSFVNSSVMEGKVNLNGSVKIMSKDRNSSVSVPSKSSSVSIFSAGDILCCSPINSSDIRNCNNLFLKKHEQEVASKVWEGAIFLGVEDNTNVGGECEVNGLKGGTKVNCIKEIQANEKRDEEESVRRERQNLCNQ